MAPDEKCENPLGETHIFHYSKFSFSKMGWDRSRFNFKKISDIKDSPPAPLPKGVVPRPLCPTPLDRGVAGARGGGKEGGLAKSIKKHYFLKQKWRHGKIGFLFYSKK